MDSEQGQVQSHFLTPHDACARLLEGNRRFQSAQGHQEYQNDAGADPYPFAAVVHCMDSRVSPELIFDQPLGQLFTLRSAGPMVSAGDNTQTDDIVGSLEFAVLRGVKLIAVFSHTRCGALKAAIDAYFHEPEYEKATSAAEFLKRMVQRGLISVEQAKKSIDDPARGWREGSPSSSNEAFVTEVARFHCDNICEEILESHFISSALNRGAIKILKGVYSVESGTLLEHTILSSTEKAERFNVRRHG